MELSPAEHVPDAGMYHEMNVAYFEKFMKEKEDGVREKAVLYGKDGHWICQLPVIQRF